ncbi:MAG TPA: PEP-CTERM sorting domain-containing protein [Tepidisphaeraceae bacterium]|nr:PEP-CTERM sorting domain-containing protein [Tepidisphaeraceae bacterium]
MNCIATTSLIVLATASVSQAAIGPVTSFGTLQSEDFNGLANTGTPNLSTIPLEFIVVETGTAANTTYSAGTGSGATGDTISYGAASSTERALGQLQSGTLASTPGLKITNSVSGGTLQSLFVSYRGEQWRLGATGRTDKYDFQYSLNATSPTTGTWVDVDALDFTAPVTTGSTGALDGNVNAVALSSTITGLSIANGSSFWLRWLDLNPTGADDGLAIDDVSVRAAGVVPEPTTLAALAGIGLIALRRRKA